MPVFWWICFCTGNTKRGQSSRSVRLLSTIHLSGSLAEEAGILVGARVRYWYSDWIHVSRRILGPPRFSELVLVSVTDVASPNAVDGLAHLGVSISCTLSHRQADTPGLRNRASTRNDPLPFHLRIPSADIHHLGSEMLGSGIGHHGICVDNKELL